MVVVLQFIPSILPEPSTIENTAGGVGYAVSAEGKIQSGKRGEH
jgi:hypothetical protein